MKVTAPGKLLLSGAYAVLEGAPALVVAVDRCAVADGSRRAASPTPEVLAAMRAEEAPEVDASALRQDGAKLGLGSSASMLVASLGVVAARRGDDLRAAPVRRRIFDDARKAHAAVQSGGSGVDVAASVHGGALSYRLASDVAAVAPVSLPPGLVAEVYWLGTPASTTEMRGRVSALARRAPAAYAARIDEVGTASATAVAACGAADLGAFLRAASAGGEALSALGRDADAPIVPPALAPLVAQAARDGAAFLPSGAGGGDVFVHLATTGASAPFRERAAAIGLRLLPMRFDLEGVRVAP